MASFFAYGKPCKPRETKSRFACVKETGSTPQNPCHSERRRGIPAVGVRTPADGRPTPRGLWGIAARGRQSAEQQNARPKPTPAARAQNAAVRRACIMRLRAEISYNRGFTSRSHTLSRRDRRQPAGELLHILYHLFSLSATEPAHSSFYLSCVR